MKELDACALIEKIARLEEKLVASDKALELAREAMKVWQEDSNKVREQIKDERTFFFTIADSKILELRIRSLEERSNEVAGKQFGSDKAWAYVVVIVGLIFGLAEIIIRLLK